MWDVKKINRSSDINRFRDYGKELPDIFSSLVLRKFKNSLNHSRLK